MELAKDVKGAELLKIQVGDAGVVVIRNEKEISLLFLQQI